MLGSNDNFTHGIALGNAHEVAATTFAGDFADFAVKTSVRQTLLLRGVNFDYDAGTGCVVVKILC